MLKKQAHSVNREDVLLWLIQNNPETLLTYNLSSSFQSSVRQDRARFMESNRSKNTGSFLETYNASPVETAENDPALANQVNLYNPVDESAIIINMTEFATGITGFRNYKGWQTNPVIPHNRRRNGYRNPFVIKQIVLHETAADVGDGFDDRNNTTAHMSVKKDGTISQFNDLVELENHTSGLNSTAIGIEFVNRGWLSAGTANGGEGIPASQSQLTASQRERYKEENGYLWAFWGYGFNIYKLPSPLNQLEKEVELLTWLIDTLPQRVASRPIPLHINFPQFQPTWMQLVSYNDVKDVWIFRGENIPPETERTQKNLFVMTTGFDYLTPRYVNNRNGIISHNATYEGHSDGSFLSLYTWLRMQKGKNQNKAFDLCKSLMKDHWFRVTPRSDSGKRIVLLDVKDINLV